MQNETNPMKHPFLKVPEGKNSAIDTLFINSSIITMDDDERKIERGFLAVSGSRISDLGEMPKGNGELDMLKGRAKRVVDLTGMTLFPGLINTHVHSFQNLLKGLESDTGLDQWLKKVITPSVAKLSPEDARSGAHLCALDGIHSGTTTVLDYQYAQYLPELNHGAIRGFAETGIRLFYGRGFADVGVQFGANPLELEELPEIARNCQELLDQYHGTGDGMVRIALAPSAVWMCSKELLQWAGEFARKHRLIIACHVAETDYDNECSQKIHGRGDFETLRELDLVGPGLLMVHCVQLNEDEIRDAGERGAAFSYNPVSNMYLASGAAPMALLKKYHLTGSLGTDGAASNNSNDMLETLKAGVLLAKAHFRNPLILTAREALDYATREAARALGVEDEIGSLEVGKRADLFVFNPGATAKASPCPDPVAGLVYASDSRNVEHVMVNGLFVLERGRVVSIDEGEAICQADNQARQLWKRMTSKV